MRDSRLSGILGQFSATAAFAAALVVDPGSAPAAQYNLIHAFCQQHNCEDGRNPQAGLIEDSAGNFYGTAVVGGANGNGAVFELKFNNSTQQYDYQILYNFCSLPNCTDGAFPDSPLIMDIDGNLYGTTEEGGDAAPSQETGIVYKLVRSEGYALHVLHYFCDTSGCLDGSNPVTGLTYPGQQTGALYDGRSQLFGATLHTDQSGDGTGVVYEIRNLPNQGGFHYTILHSFCLTDCKDGAFPSALTIDSHNHLYGVAEEGGTPGPGVFFKIRPRKKELQVLYNFCSQTACADGFQPDLHQILVRDSGGQFYGTAFSGGSHNMGTVWKFAPHRGATLQVLYNFCSQAACADGQWPRQGVTLGPNGEVFGTTPSGGSCDVSDGCGVVFELQDSTYTLLHSFCADGDPCAADGAFPFGGLLLDPSGTLYGTTDWGGGGTGGLTLGGTAFSVTP